METPDTPAAMNRGTTSAGLEKAPGVDSPPRARGQAVPALVVGVMSVAVFMSALDQTVVVTALVRMIGDLGVPITALDRATWIVSGYLLGYVIVMPLMGRVADLYGRRRIFLLCLAIFGLASLTCALANPTILEKFGASLSFQ